MYQSRTAFQNCCRARPGQDFQSHVEGFVLSPTIENVIAAEKVQNKPGIFCDARK